MRPIVLPVMIIFLLGASCQRVSSEHDTFPQPRVGSMATFQEYPRWQISGTVKVQDEHTLRFENFTFHGDKLTAQIRLQKDRQAVALLKTITGETYDMATFDLPLPDGTTVQDFNLVTIVSLDLQAPVSGAKFN